MRPTIGVMTPHSTLGDPALAGEWTLVPDRSSIRFANKTLWGLIPVNGRFTSVSGHAHVGVDGSVTGRLVIRTDSVKTGIGQRDKHLCSADFFDAEAYPEIIVEISDAGLAATLTVRATTRPLELRTTAARQDNGTVTVSARGRIDRTAWGVSGNMLGMMPTTTTLQADAVFTR